MEIKLFGKSLFKSRKATSNAVWAELSSPESTMRKSKYLPDFYTAGGNSGNPLNEYVFISDTNGGAVAVPKGDKKKKSKLEIKITPKGVYECQMLHDNKFKLNTNPEYVDQQLSDFKDKLGMISSEEYDMRKGVSELTSIVMRLENRKKYPEVKDFFDQYPYTTTTKIDEITKIHDHLKTGQIAQFIADMPKEAIETMKQYNIHTQKVCAKDAVFYIIADKKDFKNTTSRRDPILLAQSPFGHFWQILGAWDKEMMFLEEL